MQQTYFDLLPNDVLNYHLFPFLDYLSRTSLNLTLPNEQKNIVELDRHKIRQIDIMFAVLHVGKALNKLAYEFLAKERNEIMLNFLSRILPYNLVIAQHNINYRKTFIGRIKHFQNMEHPDHLLLNSHFKEKITAACAFLENQLDTKYQYLFELSSITNRDSWNPVYSEGATLISENIYSYPENITLLSVKHNGQTKLLRYETPLRLPVQRPKHLVKKPAEDWDNDWRAVRKGGKRRGWSAFASSSRY